ncbi:hypothetical protein PR003_g21993 [Phytophthora rubi]|uniref:Uncharacterized protein n=1 Tax=Phytophthora rubi TaxID=129364 RepID=A0A6A4DDJ1_9STRA|nr:hypothetical protein PR003_g21993 [Phytophthora rubi]
MDEGAAPEPARAAESPAPTSAAEAPAPPSAADVHTPPSVAAAPSFGSAAIVAATSLQSSTSVQMKAPPLSSSFTGHYECCLM